MNPRALFPGLAPHGAVHPHGDLLPGAPALSRRSCEAKLLDSAGAYGTLIIMRVTGPGPSRFLRVGLPAPWQPTHFDGAKFRFPLNQHNRSEHKLPE